MFQYIQYVLALFECGHLTERELAACLNYQPAE